MLTMKPALFKVIVDGHEYVAYADGSVSGFSGKSVIVQNHLPYFETRAIRAYLATQENQPEAGQ